MGSLKGGLRSKVRGALLRTCYPGWCATHIVWLPDAEQDLQFARDILPPPAVLIAARQMDFGWLRLVAQAGHPGTPFLENKCQSKAKQSKAEQ